MSQAHNLTTTSSLNPMIFAYEDNVIMLTCNIIGFSLSGKFMTLPGKQVMFPTQGIDFVGTELKQENEVFEL